MADEHTFSGGHITPNLTKKKKEHIRIFVHRRKRMSSGVLRKSIPLQSNSMEQLTSLIRKKLNMKRKKKHIIVINYKPVFDNSRQRKSPEPKATPTNEKFPSENHPSNRRSETLATSSDNSLFHSTSNRKPNRESVSFDVPDVEDPFMFIEMMYQQLSTEDGQLRSGTEPKVLADCVKQIVTNSRRNSMVHRDSISPNIHQRKFSTSSFHHLIPTKSTSLTSSSNFISNTFSEEDEPSTLQHTNRDINISRRSSKRLSVDNIDHQLHTFLNSYHHRRRISTTHNHNHLSSMDDTDNEDLDTFSDLNSYRKTIRTSLPASIDEDLTHTDSKLLSSSGYQSLKSPRTIISKINSENDHHYCPNCSHSPMVTVISSMNIIQRIQQPIRDIFMKYLNFILISKNVLILPLIIFLLRQRSMHIGS